MIFGWIVVLGMLPQLAQPLDTPAWAAPSCYDGTAPHWVCKLAEYALTSVGRSPEAVHPLDRRNCGTPRGCISNLQAMVRLARCESGFNPTAYNNGGNWGARGLFQITRRWTDVPDDQAFNPMLASRWVAAEPARSSVRFYPECGAAGR